MSTPALNDLIQKSRNGITTAAGKKFIDIDTVVTILVFQGLKMLLPEIKEWVKLGFSKIVLKRLEIEKRLKDYALEKELDFQTVAQATEKIAQNINENNISGIINELEQDN
jgi:hypothetical protein